MKNNNTPVYKDAIDFIGERCDIDKDTIRKVLELKMDYDQSIGIVLEENEIVNKLPLLSTYPIDINADGIYEEDIEPLYKWEMEAIKKLLNKLYDNCKEKHITPDIYINFFNKEIQPYEEYFVNDNDFDGGIYEKILPENVSKYWSYRIDETVSWSESWDLNNVGISIACILEGDYLDKNNTMENYRHLIGEN